MKFFSYYFIIPFLFLASCKNQSDQKTGLAQEVFPEQIVTDTYFGQEIKDPYRYMENVADTNVIAWYRQQEAITYQTLQKISNRQALIDQQLAFNKRRSHSIRRLSITANNCFFYIKREQCL